MNASLRNATLLLFICHVALLGLVSSASASDAAVSVGWSCGKQALAHDFLQPLKRVAPIDEPPKGRLPLAPKGLRLEEDHQAGGHPRVNDWGGMVPGGGWVGFAIRNKAEQRRHLGWIVESELSKVSARGRVLSRPNVKRQRIRWIGVGGSRSLQHRVSGNPAYYRIDIRFSRLGTGRLLGEYSHYARVMKRQVKLRVAVDNPSVLPGTLVKARLINLGTVVFKARSFAGKVIVQRFTGKTWTLVPDNPPREEREGPRILSLEVLPPGMELRGCLRYLVPEDQAPGLFRFVLLGADREPMAVARFKVRTA